MKKMSECFAWKLKKCINQSITSLWRQRSFTSLAVLLNIDFKKSLDLSLSKIFPIISFALRFATRTASCSRWPESLEGSTSRMFFISLMIFYSSQSLPVIFILLKRWNYFSWNFQINAIRITKREDKMWIPSTL